MTSTGGLAGIFALALFAAACSAHTTRSHQASQPQTPPQTPRAAVIRALDPYWRRPAVAACRPMTVRIVGDYASAWARLRPTKKCERFASNGYEVLKRTNGHWHQIWEGSDAPECSMHVPKSIVSWCMKQ